MLILVQIDISEADMALFEAYENQALAILGNHGGQLLERVRSTDGKGEIHLLHFPDSSAFDAFCADPARTALQELWFRCRASSTVTEVQRLRQP
jgi:uncharacterized protein (DUF1330 family)